MVSNFEFLEKDFPVLANFGELAEKYCYSDSNSCLMKLGMIGETIVNLMFPLMMFHYSWAVPHQQIYQLSVPNNNSY